MRGNILFVFQPAEEGAPPGEEGGASIMLQEGVFEQVQAGSRVRLACLGVAQHRHHRLSQRAVHGGLTGLERGRDPGRQTHGSRPWQGTDPIVVAAQIVNGLQTVVSRQVDITRNPAVVSVGVIKGGVRNNIIPDSVEMIGTIRTFEAAQYDQVTQAMKRMVEKTAEASGTTATFTLDPYQQPGDLQQSRSSRHACCPACARSRAKPT